MLRNRVRKLLHTTLKKVDLFEEYAIFKLKKAIIKRNKPKLFVIGFNKTGTTSVEAALNEFDIILGNQREAELLMDDIIKNDYSSLINYCKKAEAFQDIPFSIPGIFKVLDKAFKDSKFILTIRDNDQQWFDSISNFHGKLWANGSTPTKLDLTNAPYIYKGYALKVINYIYGDNYYDSDHYKDVYNRHNTDIISYFKHRTNDLLIINPAEKNSYYKLCQFIGEKPLRESFEWKNKTSEIKQ
jgi:hypothetical protein